MSSQRVIESRYFLWALLILPALPMTVAPIGGGIPYGQPWTEALLHPTGETAARLMILAMILTPLRMLFPQSRVLLWTIKRRRYLGVAAFAYALAHAALYVSDMGSLHAMLAEAGVLSIWTGWLAFLILVLLAMSSNNASVRFLGWRWKPLQRLVYPAAVATLVHWIYVHNNLASALLHFIPLAGLEGYRVWRVYVCARSRRIETA